ncbi:MAG: DUF2167 domain-containing protein [Magnetococcales bacterium]|nr:DUF2167 domain-containing protein [Magnetococcales bacterium]
MFVRLLPGWLGLIICLGISCAQASNEELYKALQNSIAGPTQITLLDQGFLELPAGMRFVPKKEANRYLEALGNSPVSDLLGLVVGSDAAQEIWVAELSYVHSGHIDDSEASHWDVPALFAQLVEGTEDTNELRRKRGFAPLRVEGWMEKPQYDKERRRLIWSVQAREVGGIPSALSIVNYNTYQLGREGYFSLNLITDDSAVERQKLQIQSLLDQLTFRKERRYQEFVSNSDQLAGYGLAALIGGVAAKKVGFFALLGLLFSNAGKVLLFLLLPFVVLIKGLFRRGR